VETGKRLLPLAYPYRTTGQGSREKYCVIGGSFKPTGRGIVGPSMSAKLRGILIDLDGEGRDGGVREPISFNRLNFHPTIACPVSGTEVPR
jgi:hypothetical protein